MSNKYIDIFSKEDVSAARDDNPFLNITNEVSRVIRDAVEKLELMPGEKLNIRHLADSLGVSTTTVREALSILETGNYIEITQAENRSHKSYRVKGLDMYDVENLFSVRKAIESEAVCQCAKWQNRVDFDLLEKNVSDFKESIDDLLDQKRKPRRQPAVLDRLFHETFVNCSGNPFLIQSYQTVAGHFRQMSSLSVEVLENEPAESLYLLHSQHASILNAVRLGFPDQARSLLESHLDYSMNSVIRKMY